VGTSERLPKGATKTRGTQKGLLSVLRSCGSFQGRREGHRNRKFKGGKPVGEERGRLGNTEARSPVEKPSIRGTDKRSPRDLKRKTFAGGRSGGKGPAWGSAPNTKVRGPPGVPGGVSVDEGNSLRQKKGETL